MMRNYALAATVAATMLAFAVPAVAGPITLDDARTAARDAAKRDRAKWPVPSTTVLRGPKCNRISALEVQCTYMLNGPLRKRNNPRKIRRSCTRKLSVTMPDDASKPVVKRTASSCGRVYPPS